MKHKLVELEDFTGSAATIYSVVINDEDETLFDKFVKENISLFKSEILSAAKNIY